MFLKKLFAKKQPGIVTNDIETEKNDLVSEQGESNTFGNNQKPKGFFKVLGEECQYETLYGYSKNPSLVNITFTPNITTIKFGELSECPNLSQVYIPKTIKRIEGNSFSKNPKLKTVEFEDFSQIELLSGNAFEGTPWLKGLGDFAKVGDTLLKYQGNEEIVHIPDNIRIIAHSAFSSSNLTQVVFSEQSICEYIGCGAFANCTNLTEITFPKSMRHVDYAAFRDCKNLRKIVVNDEIESIDFKAFSGCIALDEAHYPQRMDEKNEGIPSFLKYETFLYKKWTWEQERKRAYEWYLEQQKNQDFSAIYELAMQEVIAAGEINEEASIDEMFDCIYSHRVLGVLSPESYHTLGTKTYSWWECPKDYLCCAFVCVAMLSEDRLKKYRLGVVFEIKHEDLLPDKNAEIFRMLSEVYDFPILVIRKLTSGEFEDLLTGDKYHISSTYAGYSHDGSEDYYDEILEKC